MLSLLAHWKIHASYSAWSDRVLHEKDLVGSDRAIDPLWKVSRRGVCSTFRMPHEHYQSFKYLFQTSVEDCKSEHSFLWYIKNGTESFAIDFSVYSRGRALRGPTCSKLDRVPFLPDVSFGTPTHVHCRNSNC